MTGPEDPQLERALALAREKFAAAIAQPAAASAEPAYPDALQAACVVSQYRIDDLEKIAGEDDLERVISDSTPVAGAAMRGCWTVLPEVRQAVLPTVLRGTRLQTVLALAAKIAQPDDALHRALLRLDTEGTRALQDMDVTALAALAPYAAHLEAARRGFPTREDIERRLEMLRFLEPFARLVSDGFVNRDDEMRALRIYADVLESEGVFESLVRGLSWTRQKPILVTGVGGVGKSTLIARFVTLHARAALGSFPFAYLDFDRRVVMVEEPASLLVEAVRQIALQYPQASESAEELRRSWRRLLASAGRQSARATIDARDKIRRDFVTFIGNLDIEANRPVLLVLDTFEEVQYRNRVYVETVGKFLASLSNDIPRLRVVIAGRAAVPEIDFAQTIELGEFKQKPALDFLATLGITDRALAEAIVKLIGANPLTLRLAAAAFRREPGDPSLFQLAAANKVNVQGYLFERILRHVHDDDVKKIAHPGLVLRRVTADIIRIVLAEPCELGTTTPERAQELFDELQREVSLVSPGTDAGVVIHRADVRRLMLRPLRESEPPKVRWIHGNAVTYYANFDDAQSRAEEIYHLLWLEQHEQVRARFRDDTKQYLFNAVDELLAPEKALLSDLLGRDLPEDARAVATLEMWERSALRQVQEYLRQGDAKAALKVFGERKERSASTNLRIFEAMVASDLGELDRAAELIRTAADAYGAAGNWRARLDALMVSGHIAARRGDAEGAARALDDAESLARGEGGDTVLARILVERLRNPENESRKPELIEVARRIRDARWMQDPALLRAVAGIARAEAPDLVAKAVRFAGGYALPAESERALDELLSDDAETLEITPTAAASSIWERVQQRFATGDDETRARLAETMGRIFAGDAGFSAASDTQSAMPKIKADLPKAAELFAQCGLEPFRLGDLLARQFDRHLASITFEKEPRAIFEAVLRYADREGWLPSLLDAMRPLLRDGDAALDYLDSLGIGVAVEYVGGPALRAAELAELRRAHRSAIALIEQRVCRIEVKGKFRGTGFLVAPDLVLTASPTVVGDDTDIFVFFDFGAIGGKRYNPGVSCAAGPTWVGNDGPILLRLVRPVGQEPVGGERASRHAPVRRVFDVAAAPDATPQTLYWFWHTEKNGLSMTGTRELTITDDGNIAMYANDRDRFAGAPCFNEDFRLVALHCGAHPNRRRECRATRIWTTIRETQNAHVLSPRRGDVRLTTQELSDLREAFLNAFTTEDVRNVLEVDLESITAKTDRASVMLDVIRSYQQRGQLANLIALAAERRPDDVRLDSLARRHLGL